MNKITLTLLITLIGTASIFLPRQASAQAPGSFKYQTVVRDNTGSIIASQLVSIRSGIIQDSINGTLTYSETHSITTNQFGMIVLDIGSGTIETGTFENINWAGTSHFLKLEMDETGGTNYQLMGTSELLSVPYCLNSGSVSLTSPDGGNYEVTVDNNGNLVAVCFPQPSIADAGPDQLNIVFPDTVVTLAANIPVFGTGIWTIISGTGGIITDPNDPETEFTGLRGKTYTLRWTISNDYCFSEDDMNIKFSCPPTVTDIDGNTYNTIVIGTQCWMAENLNIGTAISGSSNQSNNGGYIEKYCMNNLISNCDIYGGLYQWDETMDYVTTEGAQGICPTGWHLPTDAEWCTLENYVDSGAVLCSETGWRGIDAGGNLKETDTIHWNSPNTGATNSSGFSALPGGRSSSGGFLGAGLWGGWWGSTEYNDKAYRRSLNYDRATVDRYALDKSRGYSVRCLQD